MPHDLSSFLSIRELLSCTLSIPLPWESDFFLTVFWFLRMQMPLSIFHAWETPSDLLKVHIFCEIFPGSPRQSQVSSLAVWNPLSQTLLCRPMLSPPLAHECAHQPQGQSCAYDGTSCVLWVRKAPWRRKWQPIPLELLPGEFHGWRSLPVG